MPGGRNKAFRSGDRTELLVNFWLNALAFTTPVPRQEDVGHDFVCALAEPNGDMLWAGPSFSVQAKSDHAPLVFKTEYARKWIREQDNPYFVAVGSKEESRVELYSTWQRVSAAMQGKGTTIRLHIGPAPEGGLPVQLSPDETIQTIYTGKPIASATTEELCDLTTAARLRSILRRWIEVDRENIVCTRAGMHWVVGPQDYETNEIPPEQPVQLALYWSHANLALCARNFGRAAAALRLTLQNHPTSEAEARKNQFHSLESALREWAPALDPGARGALSSIVKMDFDGEHCEPTPVGRES